MSLDTAHEVWDGRWRDAAHREGWARPERAVTELVAVLLARGARRVLDVGAGIGRHALAWNVLYHGDGDVARRAFAECRRVPAHGGSFQLTMLSKRHHAFGAGREIRPDTWIDDRSRSDKSHPHFYVDARTLTAMLADARFAALSLADLDQRPPTGAFHWTVPAEAV